ncbi:MAG: hypothetical protein V4593_08120 [Pseudomonadota bacterium]
MTTQPTKQTVLQNLLEDGSDVFVHLDPRRPGTLVPSCYASDKSLVLQLGYNLAIPIPDLVIEDDGFGATLSFGGCPIWCMIPWGSVYGMASRLGSIVWPEDLPKDLDRVAPMLPPPAPRAAGTAAAGVISLDAHRTPKDRRACERRLAARAKLTAPTTAPAPTGGDAA